MANQVVGSFEQHRRPVLAACLLLVLIALVFHRPVVDYYDEIAMVEEFTDTMEMFGLVMIFIAIAGRAWCTLYIGGRKSRQLVTAGPYSLCRNPLYVFSTLGASGAGAISESVVITVLAALGCAAASLMLVRAEEEKLAVAFGTKFDAYRSRVPAFWPDFSNFSDGTEVTFSPRQLASTVRDGCVFLAAYPLFDGIEMLQESGLVPVLYNLY